MSTLKSHRLTEAREIAEQSARRWHTTASSTHLLYGVMYAPGLASRALQHLGVDRLRVQERLATPTEGPAPSLTQALSPRARHEWARARELAMSGSVHYVGTEHLLRALTELGGEDEASHGVLYLLRSLGLETSLSVEFELNRLAACSLAWRMEFSPERGGETFWRPLEREVFTWRERTCVKLAASLYEDQAYGRLPILGDALEEAGCTDQGVLRHCREHAGRHMGWCWLLETLLSEPAAP